MAIRKSPDTAEGSVDSRRWAAVALASETTNLRHAVGDYAERAGATDEVVADVELAVSEALTNVVVHAYDLDRPGEMRIDAEVRDGRLTIAVSDDGGGMKPRPDSPGMGLGLPLIATLADRFEVSSPRDEGSGTAVTMVFELRPPD